MGAINPESYFNQLVLTSGIGEVRALGDKPDISILTGDHEVEVEWGVMPNGGGTYVPEYEKLALVSFALVAGQFSSAQEITTQQMQFWLTFYPFIGGIFLRPGHGSNVELVVKTEMVMALELDVDMPVFQMIIDGLCQLSDRLQDETPD